MQRLYRSLTVTGLLAMFTVSALVPAYASTKGRKNTAIALTAATAYAAFQKNKTPAVLLALGSAQAWKSYEDSRKRDVRKRSYSQNYNYSRPSGYGSYSSPRRTYGTRTTYRTYRSYTPQKSSYKPRYTAQYASRSYTRPATSPVSSVQFAQLKTKVGALQAQNAELKRQMSVNQLKAENAALKAQLDQQKAMVASAAQSRSNASTLRAGLIATAAVLGMGVVAAGWRPFRRRRPYDVYIP